MTATGIGIRTLTAPGMAANFAPSLGMVCCSLVHGGEELLELRGGLDAYAERGSTMGIPLLHPWANRLAGFEYAVEGARRPAPRRAAASPSRPTDRAPRQHPHEA